MRGGESDYFSPGSFPPLVAAWLHASCTSIIRGRDGAGMSRKIKAAQTAVLLNEKMHLTLKFLNYCCVYN